MITDQETNFVYFSELLKRRFEQQYSEITTIFAKHSIGFDTLPETKDIWARDYMPIQISKDIFIEYRYDPDYLQGNLKGCRDTKTYSDIVCDTIGLRTIKTDLIIDGGNVVKSENAIILTDKVVWENERNYSEKQLIKKLHDLFEVDKVVLIPWDEGCVYGHADGMLRFVSNEKVLISGFYEKADKELKKWILEALDNAKIDRDWLRISHKEVEDNIAYINFLQTKDLILVPALNRTEEDDKALEEISNHFPKYTDRIEKVDMSEIARHGGALNCITWTTLE